MRPENWRREYVLGFGLVGCFEIGPLCVMQASLLISGVSQIALSPLSRWDTMPCLGGCSLTLLYCKLKIS